MELLKKFLSTVRTRFLPEIILVDKSKGITSYDVIRELKKRYGRGIKMGHAGTLDPLATGLLIVGVGGGTRRLNEFLKLPKTYEVHIRLGMRTDTGDMEGAVVERREVSHVDEREIKKILESMKGALELPVPLYSAIKQGGEPLYKKARIGEEVVPPVKKMEIIRAEFLGVLREKSHYVLFVELEVSSGTYVRSIVEELGERLGVPATVAELRRTKIGEYNVQDAGPFH